MSTTYWSWTLAMPAETLPFTRPRLDSDLPDAIGAALEDDDPFSANSDNDFLHYWLAQVGLRFGRGALDEFLMLDLLAVEGATSPFEGFAIAAVPPADIPAVEAALDGWLADPATMTAGLGELIDWGDDVAAQVARLRATSHAGWNGGNLDDCLENVLLFLVRLRELLAEARERGEALVHCRYVYL